MTKYSIQCHVGHKQLPKSIKNHMTLMYLGEQPDDLMEKLDLDILFSRLSLIGENWPLLVTPSKYDFYGPDKNIPVLELIPSNNLLLARAIVEQVVYSLDIEPQTNFNKFKPHIIVNKIPNKIEGSNQIAVFFPHLHIWENNETPRR